jgi:hypothetical protein
MPEVGLDPAVLCPDSITETVSPSLLASISRIPDNTEILEDIDDLSRRLAALTAERKRPNSMDRSNRSSNRKINFSNRRSRSCDCRSKSRSSSSHTAIAALAPTIVAPTQEVALPTDLPLDMTLSTPSAGTTAAAEIGTNVVPNLAHTADCPSGTTL